MCKFFSLVSTGNGEPVYFDWKLRQRIQKKEIKVESADSHTSIADYFGFKGDKEDKLNKFEYNPFTKEFTVDQINAEFNDSKDIEKFCNNLNIKEIVPLNIKPFVNPLLNFRKEKVTRKDIELMKEWASVWYSVGASVGDSVGASVWDSVWAYVWYSVGAYVWYSVGAYVWDSVGAYVWDSVWAYVRAYMAEFVDIDYKVNLQPSQKLWHKGLVPSFDGKLWRLHGHKGKILYTISKEDLEKGKF